jgi:hypothetical protein
MLLLFAQSVLASDSVTVNRCLKYKALVIRETHYIVGLNAPYENYLGQIEQESSCREGITSFDGGKGLMQATGDTIEWLQTEFKGKLQSISSVSNPYDAHWAIRSMILYDCWLKDRSACKTDYGALRSYNGGLGLFNKEAARAKSCNQQEIELQCKRKIITLENGKLLDFCRVNIQYPYQVFSRAKKYRKEN